nr:membrane dipeptidase [Defluviimonas sediminis]
MPFPVFDGAQYAQWSRKIFEQMRAGGVEAVDVTVAYHENFRSTVNLLMEWNRLFRENADLIALAQNIDEMRAINASGRTAIFLALQNPSPIEAEIGLVEMLFRLGIRIMQLSYNNQSLLCSGWTEEHDSGLTLMGREVVNEMNRLGMVIDMSHAGERSTLDVIDYSARPVVISHANPYSWHPTRRNVSDEVLRRLARTGGLVGLSLYPRHMPAGSGTSLRGFCEMAARLADMIGAGRIGIGSDLCQDRPASSLHWMREGRWRFPNPTAESTDFPSPVSWFSSNLDFPNIAEGLRQIGFAEQEIAGIMGGNWVRFLSSAMQPDDRTLPRSVAVAAGQGLVDKLARVNG